MTIDPTTITLVGGMIVTIIAAIATGVVSVITASRLGDVGARQDAAVLKIDGLAKDTEAIKGHVNSEKTAAEGKLSKAENENKLLREMLDEKKTTAALLAQSAARNGVQNGHAPIMSITQPGAQKSLENIDTQTKAIETNTAKTDAAVQDLKSAAPVDQAREKRISDATAALEEAKRS